MFNTVWRWLVVLYRPVLIGLMAGLLWSNQIILNKTQSAADSAAQAAEQAQATTEQLRQFTRAVAGAVDDIKDNQEEQTRLIICLLAAHGENVTITPEDEEECRVLVDEAAEHSQAEPQAQQNDTSVKEPGASPKPEEPQEPVPEEPEPDSILPLVDQPLVGCVRGLCL